MDDRSRPMSPEHKYAAAMVVPSRALARMGVRVRRPCFAGDPRLWQYLPLGVVAQTLVDNELVDPKSIWPHPEAMKGPAWWHFDWRHCPRPPRRVLYNWLRGEWNAYGFMLATSVACYGVAMRQQETEPHQWIASIRALMVVRNGLATSAGLMPRPDDQPKDAVWPAIADYVFALDQAIDRILDALRRVLLDRLVQEDCDPGVRAEAIELLQRDYDEGRWPTAIKDLNEVYLTPEPVPIFGPGRA